MSINCYRLRVVDFLYQVMPEDLQNKILYAWAREMEDENQIEQEKQKKEDEEMVNQIKNKIKQKLTAKPEGYEPEYGNKKQSRKRKQDPKY